MEALDIIITLFTATIAAFVGFLIRMYYTNKTPNPYFIVIALFIQLLVTSSYLYLFKQDNFATYFLIIRILSAILILPFGYFLFNTEIKPKQIIGAIVGCIGIYLCSA
jgi:drug/metabolite transporter (DMT)-like permease